MYVVVVFASTFVVCVCVLECTRMRMMVFVARK
jgi:hypothetical protein